MSAPLCIQAVLAQLVEHRSPKPAVAGSTPAWHANYGPVLTTRAHLHTWPSGCRAVDAGHNQGCFRRVFTKPLAGTPAVRVVPAHHYEAVPVSLLKLPISPRQLLVDVVLPALKLLPAAMNSVEALVMLVAIALQESGLEHRWQVIDAKRPDKKGPARGLWQFELGTKESRGGVWGVYLHEASRYWLAQVCAARGVPFQPRAIWLALETDDVLACLVARLP